MTAVSLGLDEVKFFPAGLLGGPAAIRALAAPFTRMSFMPSGGVKAENMADYLAVPAVPAVSGSWMVDPALLRAGDWAEVTARSADAVARATARRSPASVAARSVIPPLGDARGDRRAAIRRRGRGGSRPGSRGRPG